MKGRIFLMNGEPKIDIWEDAWSIGKGINEGYCEICKKRFTVEDLVTHFIKEHDR